MADDGHGGGFQPLTPLGGPSLEDEQRAMKSGRGRMLAAMIAATVAAIGGFFWFATSQQPSEYGQIGRQINGLDQAHFDQFWACALPRANMANLTTNDALTGAIAERATRGRAYGLHVRTECMVKLDEQGPALTNLIVPEDLRADVDALKTAIDAQRTAWTSMNTSLEAGETFDLEDDASRRHVSAITRGWYDYKQAMSRINTTIRGHIHE